MVRALDREDVETGALQEKEGRPTVSEIRSGTTDVVEGRRRPRPPPKRHRKRGRKKQLKVGGDIPTNPPLWVKLNFKLEEVPSLVDTGAQFSCIRRDVMQTLVDIGVKAKKGSVSCRVTWLMGCVAM